MIYNARSAGVFLSLFVCLFCAVVALSGIVVCGKCDREVMEPDATVCPHCKAKLPQVDGDSTDVVGTSEAPKIDHIDASVVDDEIKLAQNHLRRGERLLAYFVSRNASALYMLTRKNRSRTARVKRLLKDSRLQCGGGKPVQCSVCGGAGKVEKDWTTQKFDGGTRTSTTGGRNCPACKGLGRVPIRYGLQSLKKEYEKAQRQYRKLQSNREWIAVGNAWAPWDLRKKLTITQTAILKRATAGTCPNCLGLGSETCGECKGTGRRKCDACEFGLIKKEFQGFEKPHTVRVACRKCRGKGWIACRSCKYTGRTKCSNCGGSGQLSRCEECRGSGLLDCDDCDGTGEIEGKVCSTCSGSGKIACDSCEGSGWQN